MRNLRSIGYYTAVEAKMCCSIINTEIWIRLNQKGIIIFIETIIKISKLIFNHFTPSKVKMLLEHKRLLELEKKN